MILQKLHSEKAIAFALHLEVCGQTFASPDDAAVFFGLRPLGSRWREVDRNVAQAILVALLREDIAFSSPRVSEEIAQAATIEFLGQFESEARFYSNGKWEEAWVKSVSEKLSVGPEWDPATSATFDGGVLALDSKRSGVLWIEDED